MALYTLNIALILVTGVWTSLWFIYYTEWFPLIGGVLGLGSFFAWVAFVSGLITDARKKSYQEIIDARVFSWKWTWICILGVNVLLILGIPAQFGGLRIINTSRGESLLIKISPGSDQPVFIGPQNKMNLIFHTPWFGSRKFEISTADAPGLFVQAKSFNRHSVILPDAAWHQPLVLIRPSNPEIYTKLANKHAVYYLKISLCDAQVGSDKCTLLHDGFAHKDRYAGGAFIIGAEQPVQLPDNIIRRWRSLGWESQVVSLWSRPLLPQTPLRLTANNVRIDTTLIGADGALVCAKPHDISKNPDKLVEMEIDLC
ncbi:MAG: hypothetical protein HQ483_16525 [Rhodospirillales bacterium]|nr:hypothetical protein [Rhodospirillales bacterium]